MRPWKGRQDCRDTCALAVVLCACLRRPAAQGLLLGVAEAEIRREERWSWLPVPPQRHLINFKGQDHDPRGFILFRVGVLLYWSCWLAVSVVGSAKGIHLPPPLYEYLGYGVLWLMYATKLDGHLFVGAPGVGVPGNGGGHAHQR